MSAKQLSKNKKKFNPSNLIDQKLIKVVTNQYFQWHLLTNELRKSAENNKKFIGF